MLGRYSCSDTTDTSVKFGITHTSSNFEDHDTLSQCQHSYLHVELDVFWSAFILSSNESSAPPFRAL